MTKPSQTRTNPGQYSPTVKKDAERLQFIAWLALPSSARKPRTQRELANQMGVDPATLSDWKLSPNLWEQVRQRVDEAVKEHHPDVIAAVVKSAKAGNVHAQKLYLEYVQQWSEGKRHEIRTNQTVVFDVSKLDDGQLSELAAFGEDEDEHGGS